MKALLTAIGYDKDADIKNKFTYIINGFSIGLVLLFSIFYVFFVRSALVNTTTFICLLLLISVFYFLKKGQYIVAKAILISAYFMQVFSLVFISFPLATHLNYFLFIAVPISFFICDYDIMGERLLIIVVNTITVVLLVASDIFPVMALVSLPTWLIRTLSILSIVSTISSFVIVFYFYASNLSAIHNELMILAGTDSLTGIANRRILFEEGKTLFGLSSKYNRTFSLMLIDIDYFKKVNDTYGHPAGDVVLSDLADLIRGSVRQADLCSRYGGEEFAIILKDANPEGNLSIAENLHHQISKHLFHLPEGEEISITVSIGITSLTKDLNSFDQMVVIADKALYTAKENGRDQIVVL